MDIKQLEIFVCLARTLNFSKAAEELYISQPSVSAQISSMEKSLGAQLFVRNTKGVSLTKTGLNVLVYAQKILSLRDQAIHSVNGGQNTDGTIDIISSSIPAQHVLPEIIASFQNHWPKIVFHVEQADSHRVEQEMSSFRYDFGLMGTLPDDHRFTYYPVYDDELVLVIPKNVEQKNKSIQENFADFIRQTPFIMREPGSGTRKEIENLLSKIGVGLRDLRIPAYFSDAHSILLAISRGMGVSLISKIAATMYVEAGLLKAVEMNDPLFRRQIYLLCNKELWLSPMQHAFVDYTRQFYRSAAYRRQESE
ncbi:MAG: selenium metabolism-associated LysR family transcriptional regulator [Peptococcaceae bacterium]|nr:selenium metabolism-associated LysR family transcriptional regulator [Peptococcaceae bacterium]